MNGEIAVGMVREHKEELNLVILDLTMPLMGGEETFAQIHGLAPDLPVILTSGYDAAEAVSKFGNNALAGFIQKPATVEDLLETVKTALEDLSDPSNKSDAA
jgi:two-component system, cell cycle sensor histidine kinase and response regulator CckA